MKKIVLMPVKNEAWILSRTLAAVSLWADHIIVADQSSTDGSQELYAQFPKVQVVHNPATEHSSTVRKLLLDTARGIPGNNALFSFDADELPTAHMLAPDFWSEVEACGPGTSLEFQWVQLWRSPHEYRTDGLVLSPQWKAFGFIDDRRVAYESIGVLNDHTSRIPSALQTTRRFAFPKVLHYQYVQWERMLMKQAHYRMVEWLAQSKGVWRAFKINLKYFGSKDERGLQLAQVPPEWVALYEQRHIPVAQLGPAVDVWQAQAARDCMHTYGAGYFALLDIWDVPGIIGDAHQGMAQDPRRLWHKAFHTVLPLFYALWRRLSI